MLDVVVGFVLIDGQLLTTILQAVHSQTVIEPLLVDSVLTLHLAVVTGCSNADAVIFYLVPHCVSLAENCALL